VGFRGWLDALAGIDWAVVGWSAFRILAVILLARLVIGVASRLIDRVSERAAGGRDVFGDRRFATLAAVGKSTIRYVVDFVAAVTILGLFGIDTSSILLGAGVAGLAVGFGAQNLVKDVIGGFFILLEDQYAVGDYVDLGDVDGIVESIGLRTTQIRDFGGQLHVMPNGAVQRVTNYSRGPLRVLFEVNVPYGEDTTRAIEVIQQSLDDYRAGSAVVVDGPKVLGVSKLGTTGVFVMVWAQVKSMEHWAVEHELKLRIKDSLDRAGIDISYPRRFLLNVAAERRRAPAPGGRRHRPASGPGTETQPGGAGGVLRSPVENGDGHREE